MSLPSSLSTPGRLSAAAYAPFGEPTPVATLSQSLPGSRFVNFVISGTDGGTPPPPYSDTEGDYDTYPAYMSSDEDEEYEEEGYEGSEISGSEEEDGNEEEGYEAESDEAETNQMQPQTEVVAFGPTFSPEDLFARLASTAASVVNIDDNSDDDVDYSVVPSPRALQSLAETPQLVNEEWSFPPQRDPNRSILRVRDPFPGTAVPLDPEHADYQTAFLTHLNAKSAAAGTGSSATESGQGPAYTSADVEDFQAGYADILRRERQEQDESDRREIRRARERRELEQREFERDQAERREYRRWQAANDLINERRARGPSTPPVPPRPIGQTPRLIAYCMRLPTRPPHPPAAARPALHERSGEHIERHHNTSHSQGQPAVHPVPRSVEYTMRQPMLSSSAPSTIPGLSDKPLPPLPGQTSTPQCRATAPAAHHALPHLHCSSHLGTYPGPASASLGSSMPTPRSGQGFVTGQQLAERYQRRM